MNHYETNDGMFGRSWVEERVRLEKRKRSILKLWKLEDEKRLLDERKRQLEAR